MAVQVQRVDHPGAVPDHEADVLARFHGHRVGVRMACARAYRPPSSIAAWRSCSATRRSRSPCATACRSCTPTARSSPAPAHRRPNPPRAPRSPPSPRPEPLPRPLPRSGSRRAAPPCRVERHQVRGVERDRGAAGSPVSAEAQLHQVALVPDLDHILDVRAEVLERAVDRLVPVRDARVTAKPVG